MAKYSIDTVGLQLGLQRVAGEGAVLAEQARKFGGGTIDTSGSRTPIGEIFPESSKVARLFRGKPLTLRPHECMGEKRTHWKNAAAWERQNALF